MLFYAILLSNIVINVALEPEVDEERWIDSQYKEDGMNKTDLPIPRFAPYDSSFFVDPIGGLSTSQTAYYRRLFSKAFYDSKCERPAFHVEPIYFNPGETIFLPCVICFKGHTFNGDVKHWQVLRRRIPTVIERPRSPLPEDWTILSEETKSAFLGMPLDLKNPIYPSPSQTEGKHPLPKADVYQQDGHLVITNAGMEQFGLYECTDHTFHRVHKFAYLLIPRTPFLLIQSNVFGKECPGKEEGPRLAKFDALAQWRYLPAFLQNREEGICMGKQCENTTFDEANFDSNWTVPIVLGSADDEILKKKLNLELFLKWSQWTPCTSSTGIQTRTGECHMRKIEDRRFDFEEDTSFAVIKWIYPVHLLLELVPKFKKEGVPLHSAIFADLVLDSQSIPSHCLVYPKQFMKEFLGVVVMHVLQGVDQEKPFVAQSPCFRSVRRADGSDFTMGHSVFQNRKCNTTIE